MSFILIGIGIKLKKKNKHFNSENIKVASTDRPMTCWSSLTCYAEHCRIEGKQLELCIKIEGLQINCSCFFACCNGFN